MQIKFVISALTVITCMTVVAPIRSEPTLRNRSGSKRGYASYRGRSGSSKPSHLAEVSTEKLRIEVNGANANQEAAMKGELLGSGRKTRFHEAKSKSKTAYFSVEMDRIADLSQLVRVLSAAAAIKGQESPTFDLILFGTFDKDSASHAIDQLAKVKGVDAARSLVDIQKAELRVRLTGEDFVSADDIINTVQTVGTTIRFVRTSVAKDRSPSRFSSVASYLASWLHVTQSASRFVCNADINTNK